MVSKRQIVKAKKERVDDYDTDLCLFILSDDISDDEIAECLISTPNGSITTLYCRKEHEYSIRSVMKQMKLSKQDTIQIKKLRTISQSWSSGTPFQGLSNFNLNS